MAESRAFRSSASLPHPWNPISPLRAPARAHRKRTDTSLPCREERVESAGNPSVPSRLPLWQTTAPVLDRVSIERSLGC